MGTQAYAQSAVSVRTAEHKGYSRVVLEWPSQVTYQTAKSGGEFTISFNKAGAPNLSSLSAANIQSMRIVQRDPLKVSFKVPSDVTPRHFFAGTRLIVDFYGEGKLKKAAPKSPPKASAPKAVEEKPEDKKLTDTVKDTNADEAKIREELKEEAAVKIDVPPAPEPVLEASKIKPHMIRFSSTASIGLAAFEYAGSLWTVIDKLDPLIRPQIDGPNAKDFYPVQDIQLENGKAFRMKMLENANLYAEGDSLLWKLIVTPEAKTKELILPQRLGLDLNKPRSGKVLWALHGARNIINMEDPVTGAPLIVVTTDSTKDYTGPEMSFVDFDKLKSAAGLVIRPKMSGLIVKKVGGGVEVSHPDGLVLSSSATMKVLAKNAARKEASKHDKAKNDSRRIFDFEQWQMGGLNALNENKSVVLSSLQGLDRGKRVEEFINLAKMHIANGRGAEALGFLQIAGDEIPELRRNPRLIALRGAANAFDWKTEEAFKDLSNKKLEPYEEIQYWRAFALADLGDWQQAIDVMPKDISILELYPPEIRNRLGLVLAEVALRSGNVKQAEDIFNLKSSSEDYLNKSHAANLAYLKGEAERQKGNIDETVKIWEELAEGPDDLYRAKAGLALARVLSEEKDLSPKDAIERLERLRYSWRGDGLEGQINYWLGRSYLDDNQTAKGLRLMRKSVELTENKEIADVIAQEMQDVFADFFTGEKLPKSSPVEAVELYDQFQELTPVGKKGDLIVSALAEHLVRADLFSRADDLLSYQIQHRLKGDDAVRASIRLSAIRLLTKQSDKALESLGTAQGLIASLPPENLSNDYTREISLLRVRALSQQGSAMDSLNMLEAMTPDPDINRLKADISWEAGFWDDAAEALDDVILDENISLTRPLNDDQAALILQRAVALNLSSDRIALANMRAKYADLMSQTDSARLFDVVTRQRNNTGLSDRETLLSITSEVDLFSDFLEGYRSISGSNSSPEE